MIDLETINQGEDRERTEPEEVSLDGVSLPVIAKAVTILPRFESKITFGDYTKESDQLLSTWIQSNLAGGMLINNHIEGATDQRGRWANAWTMSAEQLSLPPKVMTYAQSPAIETTDALAIASISTPLIEVDDVLYLAFGKQIWTYTASTDSVTSIVASSRLALPGYPQSNAAFMAGIDRIMVPLGTAGVSIVRTHKHGTPYTIESTDATVKAVSLVQFDNMIVAGTTDGYVRAYQLPTSTWIAANAQMKVEPDETIRHVTRFWDQSGNEAVYIITDKRIWALDVEIMKIYPSSLTWPKHATNSHGAAVWRDDAIYISQGHDVTRYTRDAVKTDMGLNVDDGIPSDKIRRAWSGNRKNPGRAITSMVGTQNFIVAAVQLGEIAINAEGNAGYPYAICAWNEAGWHVLYEGIQYTTTAAASGIYPDNLLVTESVAGYRVWWGFSVFKRGAGSQVAGFSGNAPMQSMAIPRSFHSPRQSVLDTVDVFALTGYYDTGWFDAGMRGFDKTWSHIEVNLPDPGDGMPLSGSAVVKYRTELAPNTWMVLGNIESYGLHTLKFNEDSKGFPRGVTTRQIELRFELQSDMDTRSPVIESFVLKFIKLALPGRAWELTIDLSDGEWNNMGAQEIADFLISRTYEGGFSEFIDGTEMYRVRVSQIGVVPSMDNTPGMHINMNLLEVPIPNDAEWNGEV